MQWREYPGPCHRSRRASTAPSESVARVCVCRACVSATVCAWVDASMREAGRAIGKGTDGRSSSCTHTSASRTLRAPVLTGIGCACLCARTRVLCVRARACVRVCACTHAHNLHARACDPMCLRARLCVCARVCLCVRAQMVDRRTRTSGCGSQRGGVAWAGHHITCGVTCAACTPCVVISRPNGRCRLQRSAAMARAIAQRETDDRRHGAERTLCSGRGS